VADPEQAALPKSLDGIYLLTSWLAFRAKRDDVAQASAVLLRRLPPEFAVVLARDMIRARPAFAREPGFKSFMKAHGNLITG
jgi:hypothetical protein